MEESLDNKIKHAEFISHRSHKTWTSENKTQKQETVKEKGHLRVKLFIKNIQQQNNLIKKSLKAQKVSQKRHIWPLQTSADETFNQPTKTFRSLKVSQNNMLHTVRSDGRKRLFEPGLSSGVCGQAAPQSSGNWKKSRRSVTEEDAGRPCSAATTGAFSRCSISTATGGIHSCSCSPEDGSSGLWWFSDFLLLHQQVRSVTHPSLSEALLTVMFTTHSQTSSSVDDEDDAERSLSRSWRLRHRRPSAAGGNR